MYTIWRSKRFSQQFTKESLELPNIALNCETTGCLYVVIPRQLLHPQVMESLNHDSAAIDSRCLKWHMRLNPKKTKSMVVSQSRIYVSGYGDFSAEKLCEGELCCLKHRKERGCFCCIRWMTKRITLRMSICIILLQLVILELQLLWGISFGDSGLQNWSIQSVVSACCSVSVKLAVGGCVQWWHPELVMGFKGFAPVAKMAKFVELVTGLFSLTVKSSISFSLKSRIIVQWVYILSRLYNSKIYHCTKCHIKTAVCKRTFTLWRRCTLYLSQSNMPRSFSVISYNLSLPRNGGLNVQYFLPFY